MTRLAKSSLAIVLALLIGPATAAPVHAGNKARTSVNRNTNVNRNQNVNRNVNVNSNRNVNRNVDIDRDVHRDIDIDVDHHGCCYHSSGWGVAAAVTTAVVVGSIVNTLPPSCTVVMVNGFTYQQCGSTWYQPQFVGTSTTYVVVNPPR